MNPTQNLEQEHVLIEQTLAAFESFADTVETEESPDALDFIRFVTFFREFADAGHHEKEEDILIATLVQEGLSSEEGSVASVLSEHADERRMLRAIRRTGLSLDPFAGTKRQRAAEEIREFVTLMRGHVELEEKSLFPWVRQALPEAVAREISQRLESFDSSWVATGEHEFLVALAKDLRERYRPG